MDPRVGPAALPAVQVRLGVVELLEAEAAQGRLLGVADGGLDLALPIGIPDAAGKGDDAVVGEHVAVERIERGVVDVGSEDALLEVVEDDDAGGAAQPAERLLVQRGPDLRARPAHQEPDGLAGVGERQDEEPCPPVLAGLGVPDHRSVAVVDLRFLSRSAGDDDPGLDGGLPPDGRDEAPHAGVAGWEAVVIDQVLPDGHRIAPAAERLDDQLAVGLARARLRRSSGRVSARGAGFTRARAGRGCRRWVGGHRRRNGRSCRTSGRPAAAPDHHARGLQIAADRLAPDPGRSLDASQRPAEAPQRQDLLSFLFGQDVAHAGQEHAVPDRRQRPGPLSEMAGFQASINGRFWVSTEVAVDCIEKWWRTEGRKRYPEAATLPDPRRQRRQQRLPAASLEVLSAASPLQPPWTARDGGPLPHGRVQVESHRSPHVL